MLCRVVLCRVVLCRVVSCEDRFCLDHVRPILLFRSHFSWEHTRHLLMVVDIQGVGDLYTDPQIHTANGQGYGTGNVGLTGVARFLTTHKCNAVCKALGLPAAHDVETKAPEEWHYNAKGIAFQPSEYLRELRPVPNDAVAEDLALLGMELEEFNHVVEVTLENLSHCKSSPPFTSSLARMIPRRKNQRMIAVAVVQMSVRPDCI